MIIFAIVKTVGAVAIVILTSMNALHINHARMALPVITWTEGTNVSALQDTPDETVKSMKKTVKLIAANTENVSTDMPEHHANVMLDILVRTFTDYTIKGYYERGTADGRISKNKAA